MAMSNQGVISDSSSWKCSDTYATGFQSSDFDDSGWLTPTISEGEWTNISPGSNDLGWNGALPITLDSDDLYCRTPLLGLPGKKILQKNI